MAYLGTDLFEGQSKQCILVAVSFDLFLKLNLHKQGLWDREVKGFKAVEASDLALLGTLHLPLAAVEPVQV